MIGAALPEAVEMKRRGGFLDAASMTPRQICMRCAIIILRYHPACFSRRRTRFNQVQNKTSFPPRHTHATHPPLEWAIFLSTGSRSFGAIIGAILNQTSAAVRDACWMSGGAGRVGGGGIFGERLVIR